MSNKRTILIISLIISILAVIYMFLDHYGIIRYLSVHLLNCEGYINKYPKLPKVEQKGRVIIHFAMSPDQIDKIKPFLNSLLDQTVRVDEIAVSIPYKDISKIPKHLKKVLSIHGYTKGYGCATKAVPAILNEKEADTKIIIVEPSVIYGKDFIDELVDKSNQYPDKIIESNQATLLKPSFFNDNVSEGYNDIENNEGNDVEVENNGDDDTKFKKWLQAIASTGRINLPYKGNKVRN